MTERVFPQPGSWRVFLSSVRTGGVEPFFVEASVRIRQQDSLFSLTVRSEGKATTTFSDLRAEGDTLVHSAEGRILVLRLLGRDSQQVVLCCVVLDSLGGARGDTAVGVWTAEEDTLDASGGSPGY